jgi:hypothetical protein
VARFSRCDDTMRHTIREGNKVLMSTPVPTWRLKVG